MHRYVGVTFNNLLKELMERYAKEFDANVLLKTMYEEIQESSENEEIDNISEGQTTLFNLLFPNNP